MNVCKTDRGNVEKECPRCEGLGHRIRKIFSETNTPKQTKCDKCNGTGKVKNKQIQLW